MTIVRLRRFGVADAFFDVGAVAEPVFDVGDQLAVIAVVVGGDVGDDERDGICLVDVPAEGEGSVGRWE